MLFRAFVLVISFCLLSCGASASDESSAEKPIWSRAASVLDKSCGAKSEKLLSPDRHSAIDIRCTLHKGDDPIYSLRIRTGTKGVFELPLPDGAHEIVWSPDSQSFFANGGESAYAAFFVKVYTVNEQTGVHELNITSLAQRDMLVTFPPCKAWNRDHDLCKQTEHNPEFNMSALGWTPDSKAIFVFAEVPCSSSYGGIMCQVRGYQIAVPNGRILQRLSAQQVKQQWQTMAAWLIRVPESPKYGAAHVTW
jgi:hypothetical protein